MSLGSLKADAAAHALVAQLHALMVGFDCRIAAPVLGTFAARLYQGQIAAGLLTKEDAAACMAAFLIIAMEPATARPAVHTVHHSRTTQ